MAELEEPCLLQRNSTLPPSPLSSSNYKPTKWPFLLRQLQTLRVLSIRGKTITTLQAGWKARLSSRPGHHPLLEFESWIELAPLTKGCGYVSLAAIHSIASNAVLHKWAGLVRGRSTGSLAHIFFFFLFYLLLFIFSKNGNKFCLKFTVFTTSSKNVNAM